MARITYDEEQKAVIDRVKRLAKRTEAKGGNIVSLHHNDVSALLQALWNSYYGEAEYCLEIQALERENRELKAELGR